MTITMPLRTALLVALAVAALAACTSARTTTPAATTVPRTTAAPSTPPSSASPSSASPSSSASSSSAATADCTNAQLAVTSHPATGGDSHSGIVVIFTDRRSTCTLYGYPGAAVLDASGHQLLQATRTLDGYLGGCGCQHPARLRLHPGDTASALVEGDNGGGDECLRGRALLVTPPNTTAATRIAFLDYSCHVQVHPVVSGRTGGSH